MTPTTKAETTLTIVPGTSDDARARAAAVAMETNKELVPVRIFDQGGRTMLCGVLPVRVLTRVLQHNAPTGNKGSPARALHSHNHPVATEHVRSIKSYLLNAILNREPYIIPPVTLNSTGNVEIMPPEEDYSPAAGYAVFPDESSLHITDGQHRYLAIRQVVEELRGTPAGDNFMSTGVPFMMTLESDLYQTHQDFADAGKSKPLPSSLLAVFNTRQPANRAVMELGERVKLLQGRIDATSSTLSVNSPFVFLVNQIRQFVKASLTGSPTASEQAFASSAKNTIATPDAYKRWVTSRAAFLNVMTEIIDDWKELSELPQPGGVDPGSSWPGSSWPGSFRPGSFSPGSFSATEALARTKEIREKKSISITATFLNALGVVSYDVLKDATGPEVSRPEVSGPEVSGPEVSGPEVSGQNINQDELEDQLRVRLEPFRRIDWDRSADIWEGNLVSDGRIRTQTPAIKAAAVKLLAVLAKE